MLWIWIGSRLSTAKGVNMDIRDGCLICVLLIGVMAMFVLGKVIGILIMRGLFGLS